MVSPKLLHKRRFTRSLSSTRRQWWSRLAAGLIAIRLTPLHAKLEPNAALDSTVVSSDTTVLALLATPAPWCFVGTLTLLGLFVWQRRFFVRQSQQQSDDLESTRQKLALLMEASHDAFWDHDLTTGRVQRSARWSEMLGYGSGEIASTETALLELVHPDDVAVLSQSLKAMRHAQHPSSGRFEFRVKARDGSWRWILERAKVLERDADQTPRRIVGTTSDITARRSVEEALKRSETLFRQSQDVSGVGGWELELSTQNVYWTHETYRIHDLDPNHHCPDLEGAIAFYPRESQITLKNAINEAVTAGASFDLELKIKTIRGKDAWVRTIGRTQQDSSGKVTKLYGSFQDITAKKADALASEEFQSKLLETQKLESLGVLAGGVAHDFNNLLTAILANAQLSRLFTEEGSEIDEHLVAIEKATARAADLCHQLLAYAGRSPMLRQQFELNDLVSDTVKLLELSVGKQATLELELCSHSPSIEVDRAQMSQVMMNLVINASEALPAHGGIIRVRTGSAWMTRDMFSRACIGQNLPSNQYAFLEVSDTGCGMSPETLARIFDPFFTTKFTGRGLGLATVLGIVRAHGGGFFAESVSGEGSTFRMCLPLLKTPVAAAPSFEAPSSAAFTVEWNSTRILLVDDETSVREVTAEILRRSGCEVQTAVDGIEAVEAFRRDPSAFDVVVLDLTMPGMDGVTAMRHIRDLRADAKILLMSGYTEHEPALMGMLSDKNQFLRKPFTREDLLDKIQQLLVSEFASVA